MLLQLTDLALEVAEEHNNVFSFIPSRATEGSAGYDVRACISKRVTIYPGQTVKIPLGFRIALSSTTKANNLAALLLPRSGLGANHGIVLGNLTGLIDSDYTDECIAAVWNRNEEDSVVITPGQKIAQLVFIPVAHGSFTLVDNIKDSSTRFGGFGHTGAI